MRGRVLLAAALIAAGICCILLAVWLFLPVAVNWPDSWMGGIYILGLLIGGAGIAFKGVRMLRRRPKCFGKGRGECERA
jgi:hypothetical protein